MEALYKHLIGKFFRTVSDNSFKSLSFRDLQPTPVYITYRNCSGKEDILVRYAIIDLPTEVTESNKSSYLMRVDLYRFICEVNLNNKLKL